MGRAPSVIVVGGGIVGLSTAWALSKSGARVTLVERGPVPHPRAASGDRTRIIRRAYGPMLGYQRRMDEAFAAWDALWADLGASHLEPTGVALVSQSAGDGAEVYRDGLLEGGHAVEQLDTRDAARRWPFLDADAIRWVATSPDGGVLFCRDIAEGLARWLASHGARLFLGAEVEAIEPEAGRVRLAGGDTLSADRLVIAAGAWTAGLAPRLVERLTVHRTAVAYLEPPADLATAWAGAPVLLDIGARPGGDVGGWIIPPRRGVAMKVGADIHRRPAGPDDDRAEIPGEGLRLRDHMAPPLTRIGEYRLLEVATCAYTFTADEHFMVEAEGRTIVVSACSGHGYKFGAAVGRRVARAVLDGDVDALARWIEARD